MGGGEVGGVAAEERRRQAAVAAVKGTVKARSRFKALLTRSKLLSFQRERGTDGYGVHPSLVRTTAGVFFPIVTILQMLFSGLMGFYYYKQASTISRKLRETSSVVGSNARIEQFSTNVRRVGITAMLKFAFLLLFSILFSCCSPSICRNVSSCTSCP